MAEPKQDMGALSGTLESMAKLPLYGTSPEQLQELKDAQTKALDALEQRYAQPNWYKIAAGFAKPQLGGFLASLGSASEAEGERIEQQRAQMLPIAQMRAQLAQTNVLLGQNKAVSDMLAERKAKNQPITPEFVREVTARYPDSSIAKALAAELGTQQKQQEITANIQKNALTALSEARQQGIQVSPEIYRQAGLMPPGDIEGQPPGAGQIAPPQTVPSPETAPVPAGTEPVTTLPGGARINAQQQKLADLGIPIISGVRTTEEQQKLYDERGTSPRPVAAPGTSKHEKGMAIDVDVNKLTPEHVGMLKALGYRQPLPKEDPGHWELQGTPEAPKKVERKVISTGEYAFSPLYTQADVAATRTKSDQELNTMANNRFGTLEAVGNPRTYSENQNAINAMINTITKNPQMTEAVVNPLSKQSGILGGILNAADAGMGFNVSGIAGNIHVPTSKAIIGSYSKDEKDFLGLLNTQAARIGQMQQQMNNVNPSSIRSGEIEMYNRAGIHPETQGANVMLYNLYYTKLNNEMLHEMYTRANKILNNEDPEYALNPNSRRKMMDLMASPVMSDISAKYKKRFDSLNDKFSKVIGGNQ